MTARDRLKAAETSAKNTRSQDQATGSDATSKSWAGAAEKARLSGSGRGPALEEAKYSAKAARAGEDIGKEGKEFRSEEHTSELQSH